VAAATAGVRSPRLSILESAAARAVGGTVDLGNFTTAAPPLARTATEEVLNEGEKYSPEISEAATAPAALRPPSPSNWVSREVAAAGGAAEGTSKTTAEPDLENTRPMRRGSQLS